MKKKTALDLCKNKGDDQLCSSCTADEHHYFCFTSSTNYNSYAIRQSHIFLSQKYEASRLLLWLYRPGSLYLIKYVAGPFSVDAMGRELGRNLSPSDGQLS